MTFLDCAVSAHSPCMQYDFSLTHCSSKMCMAALMQSSIDTAIMVHLDISFRRYAWHWNSTSQTQPSWSIKKLLSKMHMTRSSRPKCATWPRGPFSETRLFQSVSEIVLTTALTVTLLLASTSRSKSVFHLYLLQKYIHLSVRRIWPPSLFLLLRHDSVNVHLFY